MSITTENYHLGSIFGNANSAPRDWESSFKSWAAGPSDTEKTRCENAIKAIRDAIQNSQKLKNRNVEIFLQGSYRNRVNVRQNSDVDVGILCRKTFFYKLPDGYNSDHFGITPAEYHYAEFKNDVEQALIDHFGAPAVTRGNKAFDIKENSYRVEADVAPFFLHKRFSASGSFLEGVELETDLGQRVINWPEQHYSNGVSKNGATSRRFKGLVRIIKRLCVEMEDNGVAAATVIPGFLSECLVWNVPNGDIGHNTYKADVRSALAHIYNNTMTDSKCSEWGEVNELKYLFRKSQSWTRSQANYFVREAWDYLGLD